MEILIVVILTLFNGVFAMSELALVSARKARLQQQAEDGNLGAKAALELLEHPSRLLSTVQVGITVIGTVAGAYGGSTIAKKYLEPAVAQVPVLAAYKQEIAFALVVLLISYLSLVLGELVPKRLAMRNPERISTIVAYPMQFVAMVSKPLVWLLTASTEAVLRVFGIRGASESTVTEEEIKVLIDEGTKAGVFEEAEQEIVTSALDLADRQAVSFMTPRHDIVWIDLEEPIEVIQRLIMENPHARFPVAEGDLDKVVGIIRARDLLDGDLSKETICARMQKPLVVPDGFSGLELLEQFKRERTHMALVVDEYGNLQGLVTLHDILEAIVGDLPGSDDNEEEPWVVAREDGSYLLDGALPVEELKKLFDLDELPEEDEYRTLGGFVVNRLEHIPKAGEHFTWHHLRFEVVDMDLNRVDKVLVLPQQPEETPPMPEPTE
ncbi:Hemolysin C [Calidithermus terrae]|uniref:Hemolysin C n=1 Tax=Calidithermus terrae TaxID=1408545 RepID=A0A399ES05_9DEIN|nr:hemolysin family protein [Calidithermus terrae]RIH86330.1 Hemolysin C [Calidithermus terrae]